ncbi:MAG: double-strand break repair protein AddB [Paracoccaceae bacterium]
MFDDTRNARVFGLTPGHDFPLKLAEGLRNRLAGRDPAEMARVEVIVNTARMQTRLRDALLAQGAGFLPRIRLISDLAPGDAESEPLRARLELAQLVRGLLRRQPDLGPPSAAFSLASSLYALLDEMQGEGIDIADLNALDVSDHSLHWDRSLSFIRLIAGYLNLSGGTQVRLRKAVLSLSETWLVAPPSHPVIVAGSTGSRGPGALLLRAVARLPLGAVVLPGFDFDMPGPAWTALGDPMLGEDHPQYRYARLMADLGVRREEIDPWIAEAPPDPRRNAVVSMALRPAPVTDQWLAEGPSLGALSEAMKGVSLVEAANPRQEAMAIALILRDAAVQGKKAALITPDRTLARRVIVALDRWRIRPDDSAGRPLGQSAPGRLLRQCLDLLAGSVTAEALIALLKHPIVHSAADRGAHLLRLRDLELHLRRKAITEPSAQVFTAWATGNPDREVWAGWLGDLLTSEPVAVAPMTHWVSRHRALAESLSRGSAGTDTGEIWKAEAGQKALALVDRLEASASYGGEMSLADYRAMSETLFAGQEVRESVEARRDIMIWGTLEARAQGADLVVLGGLNDGTWPASPQPDPWFNRKMRMDAGLLLPERQIGLSAHVFQQAIGAENVILCRAVRDSDAETIPSRWVNRLVNLVSGLQTQGGPEAIDAMRARGSVWLDAVTRIEADLTAVPDAIARRNPRPAPAPPVAQRPRTMAVTMVEKLIRDPYEVYAQQILGLKALDPLVSEVDARLRGTLTHRIAETYVTRHPPGTHGRVEDFLAISESIIAETVSSRAVQMQWMTRLRNVAPWFVAWNDGLAGRPALVESKGTWSLPGVDMTLIGQPDRVDRNEDGTLAIYDYKSGSPPTGAQQRTYAKQLLLLALMAEAGAFAALGPARVTKAAFVGLGPNPKVEDSGVDSEILAQTLAGLIELFNAYANGAQGYVAMRNVERESYPNPYHPLARRGEWLPSDEPQTLPVGDHNG